MTSFFLEMDKGVQAGSSTIVFIKFGGDEFLLGFVGTFKICMTLLSKKVGGGVSDSIFNTPNNDNVRERVLPKRTLLLR